ncbi:MAG: TonB-dependent receptor [Gammaproteobacteria bacterium]|nr:TonB-dependent receptor [Gammaproteobacteria bacterium]
MNLDRKFLVWALAYAVAGLALGIYMGASQNHAELVTHAHILLVGFVLSLIYGIIHRLWLGNPGRAVANLQFGVHQASAILISVGLFLLYGGLVPAPVLDPILGLVSAGVLPGMLLMLYLVVKPARGKAVQGA